MNQESIIYVTNIVIGTILGVLLTRSWWWRRHAAGATAYWALAAWVMTLADVVFALRPVLSHEIGRLVPTLLVTIGHGVLLLGAERTAHLRLRTRLLIGLLVTHALVLTVFLLRPEWNSWRMVFNSLLWGGCSLASAFALRRSAVHFWNSAVSPAMAFYVHAAFHGLRVLLATWFAARGWHDAAKVLQIVGDLEVSFFMVALFVGLLVAQLQVRYEELTSAHEELSTLSGLLPICAWCKKVRDDDGYWQQVEEYFSKRSQLRFTHGMCTSCQEDMRASAKLRS